MYSHMQIPSVFKWKFALNYPSCYCSYDQYHSMIWIKTWPQGILMSFN